MQARWKVLKGLLFIVVLICVFLPKKVGHIESNIIGCFLFFVICFIYYFFFWGIKHVKDLPHRGARSGDLRAIGQIRRMKHRKWH
ncbi:hypothetical protein SAMN05660299_02422 [Megasphaera paucivorans]|jgi:hypothetical protein|uniref:Uncharacterized protein n=1 Tax=Megasphaera paucivorans TaxID=349095 RepID=A0A1H0A0Z7_9FIRM|nr:hypothetical protein SAMN05660299_02422 [Megasphaera paucivorans]